MKVCFAGTGSIGSRHIRNLVTLCKRRGIDLVIDLVRSQTRSLPADIATCVSRTYHSWDEIDDTYEGVFIANPTHLHLDTLFQSRHLSQVFFVEKPLVADAATLTLSSLNLPRENIYYVACPLRYTQALMAAAEIVSSNRVFSARAISSSYLPDWRPGVDYRTVYSAHKDQGGGVSIDLIHEWDYLVSLFGFPLETLMMKGTFSDLELDSDDVAIYLGRYADKLVEVHLDYFGRQPQRAVQLFVQDACFEVDILGARLLKNGQIVETWVEDANDKYLREMEMFLNLMLAQDESTGAGSNAGVRRSVAVTSPNTLEEALRVQRMAQGLVL